MDAKPLFQECVCYNCGNPHPLTIENCYSCYGLTLPTRYKNSSESIKWNIFNISQTDTNEIKRKQFLLAEKSMAADEYTAILGAESQDGPYNNNSATKKVVFLYRPGGDKRISHTKFDQSSVMASSRVWDRIKLDDWESLEEIIGFRTITHSLPGFFPVPDNCL
ncbi:hypothetical protein EAE96_000611 [Botrytis aclada]|nr:hypothetical protein EAE96_000611 [Botrytis aclada]